MTPWPPRIGVESLSAGTDRERSRPAFAGFLVDEQPPHESLASGKGKGAEIDTQRHPQLAARSDTCWSPGFELPVQTDRFAADLDWSAILIGQVEAPMMFDIGLVPRDSDTYGDRDLLWAGADHAESTTENEEFAVVHLDGIGHQDDGAKSRRVEREVGLIHDVDPIGLVRAAGSCR